MKLGEPEAAVDNFEQAVVFYPENAEIEYRLAGLYFSLNETDKGTFHLKNGLRYNAEYSFILEELFPEVTSKILVKNILNLNQ